MEDRNLELTLQGCDLANEHIWEDPRFYCVEKHHSTETV